MKLDRACSRCWMEVDEDALRENYHLARSLCHADTQFICVVKADAYGLGLFRTVQTLRSAGAVWFAVATPEEALLAREAAVDAHVLLMGPADESYLPALIRQRISLTIGSLEDGFAASKAAASCGHRALVHVKMDTGLHRLGFTDASEALTLMRMPGLDFEGVYSHLALRSREQSEEQYQCFDHLCSQLSQGGLKPRMRHLLDSIGLTRYPDWQLDGVRVGAFLYGNVPIRWERFDEGKTVVTVKARVTRVDWVAAGQGVGYDDTPLTQRTRVATLSAGYVDGYPRALSGKGLVSLHGKMARVLGLICMDQMMVDATDIPETSEGDIATLLGGPVALQAYAASGSLNRNECLALWSRRVPRVYYRDGKPAAISAEMDAGM